MNLVRLWAGQSCRPSSALFPFVLLAIHHFFPCFATQLQAQEKAKLWPQIPPASIELHETRRFFALLPLKNETGDPTLDYLGKGILRMMISDATPVEIFAENPDTVLKVFPRGENLEEIRARSQDAGLDGLPDDVQRERLSVARKSVSMRLPLDSEVVDIPENLSADYEKGDLLQLARGLKASYLLYGSYRLSAGAGELDHRDQGESDLRPMEVEFTFYNAISGKQYQFHTSSNVEQIYRGLGDIALQIKANLENSAKAAVHVESTSPGAMAYLDNVYLGRTPADGMVIPGPYTLTIEQEGYSSRSMRVVVRAGQKNSFRLSNSQLRFRANLSVVSEPEGARVYMDETYLGLTPLTKENLPPGAHRIRISKEGYIDRFLGVQLRNGDSKRVDATLNEGDTLTTFRDPNYVFMDYTYNDLTIYSALFSLGGYGGWRYYNNRGDDARNAVRYILPSLALWDFPSASIYQLWVLEKNRHVADGYYRNAKLSAAFSGLFAILAGITLWRGLVLDGREAGEISFFLNSDEIMTQGNSQFVANGNSGIVLRFHF